ncbi:MAG: YvcK family protein [Caldilineales bacterium]|nr:YvcK family protein [Caldilineales bacterium]MCW5860470.1 YvcK family protein [Caldilineales bacterium]
MPLLRRLRPYLTWLMPGLRVKRWLIILVIGITFLSLGLAYLLRAVYLTGVYPMWVFYLTLQFLPRELRAGLFGLIGLGFTVWGLVALNRSLLSPFGVSNSEMAAHLYRFRRRQRGPRIVCIGGGTGMPTVLRGLKNYTDHLTAIVTVADDGGSSGRLRAGLGLLPPGDFRNNLAALSEAEAIVTQLFQYRFAGGAGLDGHAFGNLYLAAMAGVTGSFEQGLLQSSRVLAVRGRVLPSTLDLVSLVADVADEGGRLRRVRGESLIPEVAAGGRIHHVYLDPDSPRAYPEAVHAILEADMIVAGPGSLYTSIIPNLLVKEIAQAVKASRAAIKVYVCNIATQKGETDGYDADDHFQALIRHVDKGAFTYMLANDGFDPIPPPKSDWVRLPDHPSGGYRLITADLRDHERPWRHDSDRMARLLVDLLAEVSGMRVVAI